MIYLDLPTINANGTVEQQLAEIRRYIHKSNEQMNATLSNLTLDKIWKQTASAVSSSESDNGEAPKILSQYQKVRDLIIKTADVVIKNDESLNLTLSGYYLAKSQFGDYLLNTSVDVEGDSTGFLQLYRNESSLESSYNNYKSDMQSYIKQGLLEGSGATAVYGIEVGLLKDTITVDGENGREEIDLTGNRFFKTRITPNKFSFIENGEEVAYMQSGAIHFPSAEITGGSININNAFEVNSSGVMTATSGTFSGSLTADNVSTAWNGVTGNKIKLTSGSLRFYSSYVSDRNDDLNTRSFLVTEKGLTFYKRDTVDDIMGSFYREEFTASSGYWGISVNLRKGYGQFFSINDYSASNDKEHAVTFVTYPASGAQYMPSPYNVEGLFINTPLRILRKENGTLKRYDTPVDSTIKLTAKQVWGAVNDTDIDVYIDVINGVITSIRTTA